jgi:hypothetical protein
MECHVHCYCDGQEQAVYLCFEKPWTVDWLFCKMHKTVKGRVVAKHYFQSQVLESFCLRQGIMVLYSLHDSTIKLR